MVAVEMALVTPVLFLFVFGIIDFGRAFNAQLRLSEAARQGVRTTVLTPAVDGPAARGSDMTIDALTGLPPLGAPAVVACAGTVTQASVTVSYAFEGTLFDRTLVGRAVMQCPA